MQKLRLQKNAVPIATEEAFVSHSLLRRRRRGQRLCQRRLPGEGDRGGRERGGLRVGFVGGEVEGGRSGVKIKTGSRVRV